ncbi:MAG: DegV family protein [Anaerolineales bacterium]|nr:DegV family protein [Anaerolineales bacterium]
MNPKEIALVTDSTADIPEELVEAHHIHVVNNIIVMDGKNLEDGVDITRAEFYAQLPNLKSFPTTATAAPGVYLKLYEDLIKQGVRKILSIHASSRLSGIYNAACAAAQSFGDAVQVIDSRNVSLGLGFQVLAAAEALQNDATLEAVRQVIESIRQRLRVIAMLDTLEYVKRSGRVNWLRAQLGDLLRIKMFLEVKDGQVFSLGGTRTYRKGFEWLLEHLTNLGAIERLAVLHTNAEAQARQFLHELGATFPIAPLIINVTSVIGSHVGPNGLGFAAVLKE